MTTATRERIHDPVHGASYEFGRDRENLWVYTWLEPGGGLPEHFHPVQEERWESLEGQVRFKLDGRWRDLRPEDGPVSVMPNHRHALGNPGSEVARLRTEVLPAGHLQEFLIESARAARDGFYTASNLPRNLRGARWILSFAAKHQDETVMCFPPPALQRPVLSLVRRRRGR